MENFQIFNNLHLISRPLPREIVSNIFSRYNELLNKSWQKEENWNYCSCCTSADKREGNIVFKCLDCRKGFCLYFSAEKVEKYGGNKVTLINMEYDKLVHCCLPYPKPKCTCCFSDDDSSCNGVQTSSTPKPKSTYRTCSPCCDDESSCNGVQSCSNPKPKSTYRTCSPCYKDK
jgi:hypothetical protein